MLVSNVARDVGLLVPDVHTGQSVDPITRVHWPQAEVFLLASMEAG